MPSAQYPSETSRLPFQASRQARRIMAGIFSDDVRFDLSVHPAGNIHDAAHHRESQKSVPCRHGGIDRIIGRRDHRVYDRRMAVRHDRALDHRNVQQPRTIRHGEITVHQIRIMDRRDWVFHADTLQIADACRRIRAIQPDPLSGNNRDRTRIAIRRIRIFAVAVSRPSAKNR